MLDLKILRYELERIAFLMATRGFKIDVEEVRALSTIQLKLQTHIELMQRERNSRAKEISNAKDNGEEIHNFLCLNSDLCEIISFASKQLENVQQKYESIAFTLPNIQHPSTPGTPGTKVDNVEIYRWGKQRIFDFKLRDHIHYIDLNLAVKLTGSRFTVMFGDIARLHRALAQFMLDIQITRYGYIETYVPYMVNGDSLFCTGQLPKFTSDLFCVKNSNYYLIPTGEVPITNLVRGEILSRLPIKLTAHTPCFRSEAGTYGRDSRGMIRQHQFDKIEIVQIVHPDHSYDVLEEMRWHAESILRELELPYRVMALCTSNLCASAAKTYDIEVLLPSQQTYREISSISNCEDFQARRMQARLRKPKPALVHTINGSGLAVGRCLIAVMENYQNSDGSITVPVALRPYMGGVEKISFKPSWWNWYTHRF